jgi:hypothetical protein
MADTITLSITEYEQLKKDAERYRWLRCAPTEKRKVAATYYDLIPSGIIRLNSENLDSAIDQAISEDKHNG